ncbi:MAG: LEA type 2 family protein [Treponemataceae bacterium]|nr:LEA type 2 family protein [Treponemataceae bacterium]
MATKDNLLITGLFEMTNTSSQEIFLVNPTVHIIIEDKNHRITAIVVPLSSSENRQTFKAGETQSYPFSASLQVTDLVPDEKGNLVCHLTGIGRWGTAEQSRTYPLEISQTCTIAWLRAPELRILSLAVKQAELVNTRFRIRFSIYNPNAYPLTIHGMQYELFGNGRPWADGTLETVYTIAPTQTTEIDLFVVMNFIDMGRDLFNQVLIMKDISYRCKGTLLLATPLEEFSSFSYPFNLEGLAPVER